MKRLRKPYTFDKISTFQDLCRIKYVFSETNPYLLRRLREPKTLQQMSTFNK